MSQEKLSPPGLSPEDVQLIMEKLPSSVVGLNINKLKKGSVLDLGAGSGRNSLLLASNGFTVTAVDNDPQKIEALRKSASEYGNSSLVTGVLADLASWDLSTPYDNIIGIYSLRFLDDTAFHRITSKLMAATTPGGVNIIQDLTNSGPLYNPHTSEHWPAQNELLHLYEEAGWNILTYTEENLPTAATSTDGRAQLHLTATIVARKNR